MEMLPLTFASAWASGINAYATVLILGLLGRFTDLGPVPEALQRTDVLIAMAVLTVIEFVADKVPYLDSAWDAISTVVRPIAGAVIGALLAGNSGDLLTITLASVGGLTALISHLAKAGLRLAINTSPEPVTNLTASIVGDLSVAGVVTMALLNPLPAAIVAAVALAITVTLTFVLLSRVRRGWQVFRNWATRTRTV